MRQDLATVRLNLDWTAYQSTPGAPIYDYDADGRPFLRPTTAEEADQWRPEFAQFDAELAVRDPDGHAAWSTAFAAWRRGDLSAPMPSPEDYAVAGNTDVQVGGHRLFNTGRTRPMSSRPHDDAYVFRCVICHQESHAAGFRDLECTPNRKAPQSSRATPL
jgi:hypothetical protein